MKRNFAAEIRERWFPETAKPVQGDREQLGWLVRYDAEVRRQRRRNGVSVPEVECRVCAEPTTNPEPYCNGHLPF